MENNQEDDIGNGDGTGYDMELDKILIQCYLNKSEMSPSLSRCFKLTMVPTTTYQDSRYVID